MPQESDVIILIGKLKDEVDKAQKFTIDQDQLPIVVELRQQISDLKAQLDNSNKFVFVLQQQIIKQLLDILSESGTLTGPSYRRLQPKLDNLQRLISNPEEYIKPPHFKVRNV
jgi:hypothetical protein